MCGQENETNTGMYKSRTEKERQLTLRGLWPAEREGVAGESRTTRTGRKVIDNATVGVLTARPRARVLALVAQARQAGGAV